MKRMKAFTLAEVIIVLTVLGIVAMLTMPSLIKHQQEVANRTKIKRAISDYDRVIQNIAIENDLHSDTSLAQWADTKAKNNCANTSKYFKVASGSGCIFKTPYGVWWNIDDIMHPTIALKEADLDNLDNDTTFKLVTSYDPNARAFRSNDLAYEMSINGEEEALTKVLDFVNNKNDDKENIEAEDTKVLPELTTMDSMEKLRNKEITFQEMITKSYPEMTETCSSSKKTSCIEYGGSEYACKNYYISKMPNFTSILSDAFDCPAYAVAVLGCWVDIYDDDGNLVATYLIDDIGKNVALQNYIETKDDGVKVEHHCYQKSEECYKYYIPMLS